MTPVQAWLCAESWRCLRTLQSQRRVGKAYARRRLLTLSVLAAALRQGGLDAGQALTPESPTTV